MTLRAMAPKQQSEPASVASLAKRQSETIFNIVSMGLQLAEAETTAYDTVFRRLDNVFQYETMTELPADFEAFFVKLQRRIGKTVQEYQAEFDRVERRLIIVSTKIQLPEKVRAW